MEHEEIHGERVHPPGFPFTNTPVDSWHSWVVDDGAPSEQDYVSYYLVSSNHGRSHELRHHLDGRELREILWQDEYGNYFLALSEKGNRLDEPRARRSQVTPSGFAYHGLLESDSVLRVLKASRILRQEQIETEVIGRLIEPLEFPLKDKVLTLEEFKRLLVRQVWEENAAPSELEEGSDMYDATRDDIPRLVEHLDKIRFFKTIRAMVVNERLGDYLHPQTREDFLDVIRKVFRAYNTLGKLHQNKDPEYYYKPLDPENQVDIDYFFYSELPVRIVINMAKMHNRGLKHSFLNLWNIEALGGICDLDSVKGAALGLGDEETAAIDLTREALLVFLRYRDLLIDLAVRGDISAEFQEVELGDGSKAEESGDIETAVALMHVNYLHNRSNEKLRVLGIAARSEYLIRVYNHVLDDAPGQVFFLMDELLPELGWDYRFEMEPHELLASLPEDLRLPRFAGDPQEEFIATMMHSLNDQETFARLEGHIRTVIFYDLRDKRFEQIQALANQFDKFIIIPIIRLFSERELLLFYLNTLKTRIDKDTLAELFGLQPIETT